MIAQQAGGTACFIDTEHALDLAWATTLGVDLERLVLCRPSTASGLQVAEVLIGSGSLDVAGGRQHRRPVPASSWRGGAARHAGVQANLLSQALRKLCGPIARANTASW